MPPQQKALLPACMDKIVLSPKSNGSDSTSDPTVHVPLRPNPRVRPPINTSVSIQRISNLGFFSSFTLSRKKLGLGFYSPLPSPLDPLNPMAQSSERSKGTVKWFNSTKGFGFISPDDGSEDLFVHQSSINSDGYRTLGEGESVEFSVVTGDDGRTKAVEVTGPDGSAVKGDDGGRGGGDRGYGGGGGDRGYGGGGGDRGYGGGGGGYGYNGGGGGRGGRGGGRGYGGGGGGGGACYSCGETGHMARDCGSGGGGGGGGGRSYGGGAGGGSCYSCGEAGHFARDCQNPRS